MDPESESQCLSTRDRKVRVRSKCICDLKPLKNLLTVRRDDRIIMALKVPKSNNIQLFKEGFKVISIPTSNIDVPCPYKEPPAFARS